MHSLLRCRLLPTPLLGVPITLASRSFRQLSYDYVNIVDEFARHRAFRWGNVLHAHLVVNGLSVLSRIASRLAVFYIECGRATDALQVFDNIQERSICHWIVYLGALVNCGFHADALGHFRQMQRLGLRPDKVMLPSLLKACGQLRDVRTGEGLHGLILKCSLLGDAFVDCGLIDMYAKCGHVGNAGKVFDGAEEMDLAMLNAMVSGYAKNGYPQEAFQLAERAKSTGLKPDVVTWNAVIAGFSKSGDVALVMEIFALMRNHCTEPDVVSWTSVISGCVQNFQTGDAFRLFKEMLGEGIQPNSATISSLLPACASLANAQCGKELHGHAVVTGVESDIFVTSALIDMYAKCGFMTEASSLFEKMSEKNTVSWNSMIFGLGNHGYCEEAINTFCLMEKEAGKMIDHLTFTAVLTACSHRGKTELGENLFKKMQVTYGIAPKLEHYACMVDLLGRAGKLRKACDFIKGMPMEPDLFVWGALLGACRRHGDLELARIAARHLSQLEPENTANSLLLSGIYVDAGAWEVAERMKRKAKGKRRATRVRGSSWVEATKRLAQKKAIGPKQGPGFGSSSYVDLDVGNSIIVKSAADISWLLGQSLSSCCHATDDLNPPPNSIINGRSRSPLKSNCSRIAVRRSSSEGIFPARKSGRSWRVSAAAEDALPLDAIPVESSSTEIVSAWDEGVSTIIQVLLFVAIVGLSFLINGVIYIAVTDFLQKREREKFEKEEAAQGEERWEEREGQQGKGWPERVWAET